MQSHLFHRTTKPPPPPLSTRMKNQSLLLCPNEVDTFFRGGSWLNLWNQPAMVGFCGRQPSSAWRWAKRRVEGKSAQMLVADPVRNPRDCPGRLPGGKPRSQICKRAKQRHVPRVLFDPLKSFQIHLRSSQALSTPLPAPLSNPSQILSNPQILSTPSQIANLPRRTNPFCQKQPNLLTPIHFARCNPSVRDNPVFPRLSALSKPIHSDRPIQLPCANRPCPNQSALPGTNPVAPCQPPRNTLTRKQQASTMGVLGMLGASGVLGPLDYKEMGDALLRRLGVFGMLGVLGSIRSAWSIRKAR